MFTIKAKLLFLLVPVTLLMLTALASVHYQRTTEIVTRQAQESLQTRVRARQVALAEYFESAELLDSTKSEIKRLDQIREYREHPENWLLLPDRTNGYYIVLKRKRD